MRWSQKQKKTLFIMAVIIMEAEVTDHDDMLAAMMQRDDALILTTIRE